MRRELERLARRLAELRVAHRGERADFDRIGPGAGSGVSQSGLGENLLEREPLLRQLELAWRGGHTRLALVGTPGVGTTSVAAAFASRLTGELGFWDGLLDRGTPPTDAGTAWVYDHADGVMDAIVEAARKKTRLPVLHNA